MEVDVAIVPRTGMEIVKGLVRRELRDRKDALDAAKGWVSHRKWEQDNRQFLDLAHWLEVAEETN